MLMAERVDRFATAAIVMSAMSGTEFVDPRDRLDEWLNATAEERPDAALRRALGVL